MSEDDEFEGEGKKKIIGLKETFRKPNEKKDEK